MQRLSDVFGRRRKLLLSAAGLVAVTLAVLVAFGLVNSTPGRAQSQTQSTTAAAPAPDYKYDIVSVKPVKPGAVGGQFPTVTPDGFIARNMPLMRLLYSAFGIFEDYRFSGVPAWGRADRFDVEAKIDSAVTDEMQKLSPDDRRAAQQHMQQALLADRFKLAFHSEMKEVPVYFLVVAKNGPKFHEANPESQAPGGRGGAGGAGRASGGGLTLRGGSLTFFAQQVLSVIAERTVIDKTGLTGKYDFTLHYGIDSSEDPNAPPLFTALEEQLGLKLESGKAPVEMIVIDHVERPSGN